VLVRERIGDELAKTGWQLTEDATLEAKTGWQLTEDATLEAGGCRVETPSNQIDAALPVRWQRLVAALGKQTDWLA